MKKSKIVAALLALFLGGLGIHRFYVGKIWTGVAMILITLTFVGAIVTAIWALIDFVRILTGGFKTADGEDLK